MLRHGIRVGVAILTFSIGIAIFWPLRLIQRLESALVERFYGISDHDLRPVSLTPDCTAEANDVYRLILHQKFGNDSKVKLIVLRSETIGYSIYVDDALKPEWAFPQNFHKMMKESMPEVEFETLSNFLLRNTTGEPLQVWNLGINYVLATNDDVLDDGGPGGYWAKFYERFPNSSGLVSFSNVGFNEKHNQAFVFVARTCGYRCGAGEYVLLKKVHGKWEIVKEDGLWVS